MLDEPVIIAIITKNPISMKTSTAREISARRMTLLYESTVVYSALEGPLSRRLICGYGCHNDAALRRLVIAARTVLRIASRFVRARIIHQYLLEIGTL